MLHIKSFHNNLLLDVAEVLTFMFSQIFTDLEYTYDKKKQDSTFFMKVLKKLESKRKINGSV